MVEQSKLRLHIELFDAEENLRTMEEARRQCIEVWNRDLREARRIVEAKRNEVRTGRIQPELFDMLTGKE